MRLPRRAGRYQARYFDSHSPKGVCCGESNVVDFVPRDTMEALAYTAATGVLRVRWSCFTHEPSSWFWIGVYTADPEDPNSKAHAKRLAWNWCCKGTCSKNGDSGMLDLQLPQQTANTARTRNARAWQLQHLLLRFYASSSELLFEKRLEDVPPEPSSSSQ